MLTSKNTPRELPAESARFVRSLTYAWRVFKSVSALTALGCASMTFFATSADAATDRITVIRLAEGNNYNQLVYPNLLPHQKMQTMYPDLTGLPDGNAQAFRRAYMEGNVLGFCGSSPVIGGNNGRPWTRALDTCEEYDYNFVDFNELPPSGSYNGYWSDFNASNASGRIGMALVCNGGIHNGQSYLRNANVIAMSGSNGIVLYDPINGGTISWYNYINGTLSYERAIAFSAGTYAGTTLSDHIGKMIGMDIRSGVECMYFLDFDDALNEEVLVIYTVTGSFISSSTVPIDPNSPFAGYTLGDIVDGRVPGWSYVGWQLGPIIVSVDGIVIPEPGTAAMLVGTTVLAAALLRRKRN